MENQDTTNINPISSPAQTPIPPVSPVIPASIPKSSLFPILFVVLILVLLAATGVFAYQNMQLQKQIAILQTQPTPTLLLPPTPQTKPDLAPPNTSNWKTYTSSAIGVEFKYPPDWKITTFPNNSRMILMISSTVPTDKFGVPNDENSPGYIRVIYFVCEELSTKENIPCDTFDQLAANTKYDLQPKTIKETSVTISEKQGTQISGVSKYEGFRKYTFFSAGEYQQSVVTYHAETEAIYDQILSTFKFLDQNNPKQNCEIDYIYENTAASPITCQCPLGYEKDVLETTWGSCPKAEIHDCPQTKFKCIKK